MGRSAVDILTSGQPLYTDFPRAPQEDGIIGTETEYGRGLIVGDLPGFIGNNGGVHPSGQ